MVGYFDWAKKDYKRIPVNEQVEVLSLLGDVAVSDGKPPLDPETGLALISIERS